MPGEDLRSKVRQAIQDRIKRAAPSLKAVSYRIHSRPETGYEETEAASLLVSLLEDSGFRVENRTDMPTAFAARAGVQRSGPTIAFLCEYDALPDLGHACGHNLIAGAGCGAGIGLAAVLDTVGGQVMVIGCPAEEGGVDDAGGKVRLLEQGAFRGVDAAVMVHPATSTAVHASSTAREALEVTFRGRAVHAAGPPEDGVNALDALLSFFQVLNVVRARLPEGTRIHGIITDGGVAPNIIPEVARGRFYIRSRNGQLLDGAVSMFKDAVRGVATATGTTSECRTFSRRYLDLVTNRSLAGKLADNMDMVGLPVDRTSIVGSGSTDMGNVSQSLPAVHAFVTVPCDGAPGHSREFAAACGTERAMDVMVKSALAMALTGADIMLDRDLALRIRSEADGR